MTLGGSGREVSAAPCWGHIGGNKETQGTYHYTVPPMSPTVFSFHLSESSWLVCCVMMRFVVVVVVFICKKKDREEWNCHIDRTPETIPCSSSFPASYKSRQFNKCSAYE